MSISKILLVTNKLEIIHRKSTIGKLLQINAPENDEQLTT